MNKTRQRLAFYTFFQTTLPTSGARDKIEDDESIRSPSPLAPLEAEGRERDGHGDDDGINHTRLDRPLRGTGGRGGITHSPAAGIHQRGERMLLEDGSSLEPLTKQTRLGLVWKSRSSFD